MTWIRAPLVRQSTRASQKLAQQWLANRGARIPKFAPPPLSRWTKVDSLDSPEAMCVADTLTYESAKM